jgi:transcription antitermination factor NusG
MDMKWYLVYTKPGFEKKVSDSLTRKKIENYTPVTNFNRKPDNSKNGQNTLFQGYVFIKTVESCLPEIKKINGIINLVYWMGKPVSVKNVEIKAIRLFLHEYTNVTIEKTSIKSENINDISIDADIEEESPMITIKNKKAFIGLPSLGYVMSAEIETANVRIISSEDVLSQDSLRTNKLINKVSEFNNSLKNYWAKSFIIAISIMAVTC